MKQAILKQGLTQEYQNFLIFLLQILLFFVFASSFSSFSRLFECLIVRLRPCKKKKNLKLFDCLIENTNLYKKFCKKKLRIKMVNEELLADTVRKYTVLYDKSSADFKGMMLRELLPDGNKTFRNYKNTSLPQ